MSQVRAGVRPYLVAAIIVLVAMLLRVGLNLLIGNTAPYSVFVIAIAVASWYGGFWPGLLSAILGSLAVQWLAIEPVYYVGVIDTSEWVRLVIFYCIGVVIAGVCQLLKSAARQVQVEREQFFVTLASIGDGVIVADPRSRVMFLNPTAEELTGWKSSEAIGQPLESVFQITDEQTGKVAENPVERALGHGRLVGLGNHTLLHSRQGPVRAIDDSAAPIRDDKRNLVGVVVVFRDVSEDRRAAQALQESESLLRAIFDSANVGIILADPTNGRYVRFNQKFCEITGYSEEELHRLTFPELTHPEDRDQDWERYCRLVRGEVNEYSVEKRYLRKNGEVIWVHVNCVILRDQEGRPVYDVAVLQDITQQRFVADALRESEERFRNLTRYAPASIFIKDAEGRYMLANSLACEVLGHPEGVEGLTDFDLMPPELASVLRAHDQEVMTKGVTAEREVEVGWHGRQFLSVKFPWLDKQGHPQGVCGVAVEITERKRAEQARRDSEAQFRQLSDSMPQLAWMARPDGDIFWYNRRWYEFTGATPEQMQGNGWQLVHDPAEVERVIESWQTALARETPWEDVFPLRRHDGEMRWHLSRAMPLRDESGNVQLWFGTNTDITERRRTEATWRFLADVSESLASLVDSDSALQKLARLAVPAFADWCAVDLCDGENQLRRVALHHADADKLKKAWAFHASRPPRKDDPTGIGAVWRSGEPQLIPDLGESRVQSSSPPADDLQQLRDFRLASLICVPLRLHGHLYGVLTFLTAESKRRYDANDLSVAEDVAHRAMIAIDNARLYNEVREADRRKDEFLAMLSHELRNPLAPIRSGLDVLALERKGDPEMLQLMQQQVDHLVRLVDDLLDVSRIIRGRIELRREAVELSAVIRRAVNAMQPQLALQSQTIQISKPDVPVWLDADPVRLVQVIENLMNNASKYSEPGSVIEIRASLVDGMAHVSVIDHGIGIEPELLPRIFDLFTQATRSLDRSQGGLGIGLTLVKNLVEMHGGSISVRSNGVGEGSEFTVHLPTIPEPMAKETLLERSQRNGAFRIVVVDDNFGNTRIVSVLLGKLGAHHVETAYEGVTALALIARVRPHIVLLDIGLPGMSGYEVAEQIRQNPDHDDMLLVAVTGYGQEEDRRRSAESGFDDHLVKPVSLSDLEQLLVHPKLQHATRQASDTEVR